VGVLLLILWGLLYRFADGVTFTAALTLHTAQVAVRDLTTTDPMQDMSTMTNYPWLVGLSGAFQIGVWLSAALIIWRKWTEVADRPAPWAALASGVWGLWVAAETLSRPWAKGGQWIPPAAWALAALALAIGVGGAYSLMRLDRFMFGSESDGKGRR